MKHIVAIVVNAVALWLTTLLVSGVHVTPYTDSGTGKVLTYVVLGVIWGLVNTFIGGFIRFAGFCFYVLTLGLIALIVNGALFEIVAAISRKLGWGLIVDSFGWAVFAALVMAIIAAFVNLVARHLIGVDAKGRRDRD